MIVLAIDPGNIESAFVERTSDGQVISFGKYANDEMLALLRETNPAVCSLAIEMIASYGMPVGAEVFETCVWIGRFIQAWGAAFEFVYRREVKLHLCNSARAKDGNVRAALIDRYGGKAKAIGKKAAPGPLFGISADVWSALAVAVTFADRSAA